MHLRSTPAACTTGGRQFTRYLFTESPTIRAGQTFGVEEDAPVYRLLADAGPGYEEGSPYANPLGYWRLVRATGG